ncbi:MAG TPA: carbohydrate kinase family protein, partial [Bacilli bacterium]|nr:carbohydrate kinase family protein [Bacilli bacterium]
MKKVLCVGRATYEMSLVVDEFPRENSKNNFVKQISCGGGAATNCAYLLGKWNLPAVAAAVIGNDMYGNRIKAEFESAGLVTKYLEPSFSKDTTFSIIIINRKTNTRTMFNVAEEYMGLKKLEFDFSPEVIYCDCYDYAASRKLMEMFPKAQNIVNAAIPNRETLELAKKAHYLICTKDFA